MLLHGLGIKIARRTVAKYREELGIPPPRAGGGEKGCPLSPRGSKACSKKPYLEPRLLPPLGDLCITHKSLEVNLRQGLKALAGLKKSQGPASMRGLGHSSGQDPSPVRDDRP